jgi:acetylornithine deacetylase
LSRPSIEQIRAAVERHEADLVSLVQRLVRIPSVTGNEGAAQELVAMEMASLGMQVDVWEPSAADLAPYAEHVGEFESLEGRPNVVGTWSGSGEGRSLILNSHIDTVEPGDPATWSSPAFDAAISGRSIVGRGALDMKGGLATNLIALGVLRELGFKPGGTIHVESVISEEDGGAGGLATILRGYRADAAIITEPTNLAIVTAQGGSLVFRIRIQGKSAHAAVRDEGISAFEKFIPIWNALNVLEARRNQSIDHPLYRSMANKIPINIGVVQSGSWPSSVPEWLIAEGRAGLVPGETLAEFKDELVQTILDAAAADGWLAEHPPVVEFFSGQFAPAEIPVEHPLVETVSGAHATVTGSSPAIVGVSFGADMRHFIHAGNMPCLMYGAGDVNLAHHADEAISIDDLLIATSTIATIVVNWCGRSTN